MRTRSRLAIALGSILWLLGLSCLIVWHQIWAPVFAAPGQTTSTVTPYYANDPGGSFRDDFDANEPLERREVDIVHPRHGPFACEADAPGGGQARLTGGALMAATRPVQDGTVSVRFSHPDGGDPTAGVFVTVFGRVQEETQPTRRDLLPYQTGYAFEWDMHDGRQRLWAGSTLLAERPAPGDSHAHTLALVMQGTALQGLVDGAVALQASDSRYETGLVGFGGHGRLPIVFTQFELARPGQGGPAPLVDVGAPFDLTEAFIGLGDEPEQNRNKETYSYGSSGEPIVYRPWYAVQGRYGQNVRRRRDGVNQVVLAECFYLPLDSKHARTCTVTASCGRIRLMPREQAYTPPFEHATISTLLARVQSADAPLAGCYGLDYDWQQQTLRLFRSDATGPPSRERWPRRTPTRRVELKAARVAPAVDPALLVLSAQGTTISGGVQGQPLLTVVDATYPQGYVGFGAAEDTTAVFDWVRMTGE